MTARVLQLKAVVVQVSQYIVFIVVFKSCILSRVVLSASLSLFTVTIHPHLGQGNSPWTQNTINTQSHTPTYIQKYKHINIANCILCEEIKALYFLTSAWSKMCIVLSFCLCLCNYIYLVCVCVFVFWLLCFVQVEADYGGAHPLLATTWPTGWRNFQPAQGKSPTQENTIRKHDTNRKSQTQVNTPRKHDTNTTNGVTCTQPVNNITGILHNVQCRTLGLNHSDY